MHNLKILRLKALKNKKSVMAAETQASIQICWCIWASGSDQNADSVLAIGLVWRTSDLDSLHKACFGIKHHKPSTCTWDEMYKRYGWTGKRHSDKFLNWLGQKSSFHFHSLQAALAAVSQYVSHWRSQHDVEFVLASLGSTPGWDLNELLSKHGYATMSMYRQHTAVETPDVCECTDHPSCIAGHDLEQFRRFQQDMIDLYPKFT